MSKEGHKAELQDLISQLISGNDEGAERAAKQLAAHGLAALELLRPLLTASEVDVRWWAVRALAEMDAPDVGPLLCQALQDPEVSVRQCAALALKRHPTIAAIPHLISLLEDSDRLLARLAAEALISLGEDAVPDLIAVMQNGPQVARLEAVRVLALIGDPRAAPALFDVLGEGSALLEHWALEGLERMGMGMVYFKPGD